MDEAVGDSECSPQELAHTPSRMATYKALFLSLVGVEISRSHHFSRGLALSSTRLRKRVMNNFNYLVLILNLLSMTTNFVVGYFRRPRRTEEKDVRT